MENSRWIYFQFASLLWLWVVFRYAICIKWTIIVAEIRVTYGMIIEPGHYWNQWSKHADDWNSTIGCYREWLLVFFYSWIIFEIEIERFEISYDIFAVSYLRRSSLCSLFSFSQLCLSNASISDAISDSWFEKIISGYNHWSCVFGELEI